MSEQLEIEQTPDPLEGLNIAIHHGQFFNRGGGVAVAEELARTFDAPLYYGFGDDDLLADDVDTRALHEDTIGSRLEGSKPLRELWHMIAGQRFPELAEYDVIVQSGNETGWYVPPDDQTVVRFTHSTSRLPWDLFHVRGSGLATKVYGLAVRVAYPHTIPFVDQYVANSEIVARRLRKYWDREDVPVVYPPVDVQSYPVGYDRPEGVYFTFSRLTPNKRIGEMVDAFRGQADKALFIGGKGPLREELEPDSPDNVQWLGYLSEQRKREWLTFCTAFVFNAKNEDFGLAPVEAFAAGTPVIGVDEGFTAHQIIHGRNGWKFQRGGLSTALDEWHVSEPPVKIASWAQQFGISRFRREMRKIVAGTVENNGIQTKVKPIQ